MNATADIAQDTDGEGAAGVDSETEITLGLLTAVDEDSGLTQRSAARRLGIALGLTNAYLKRCVKKGLIKVQQVPHNRYAYYLTPKGFAEKSRLTAEYLSSSLTFFRRARGQSADLLRACAGRGWRRVALAGVSELAEIVTLSADGTGIELVGIVDPASSGRQVAGLVVVDNVGTLAPVDAVLVTDVTAPQQTYERMADILGDDRVVAPALLRINRGGAGAAGRANGGEDGIGGAEDAS